MKMGQLRGCDSTFLMRMMAPLLLAVLLAGGVLLLLINSAEAAEIDPADEAIAAPGETLALYVLAFDNQRDTRGAVNLTKKYTDTLEGIVDATVGRSHVTAVVLADLDADEDTRVLIIRNGLITRTIGLPNPNGNLEPTLKEYDTTDGDMLGGFLKWARQVYPADRTTFSYIGHGSALAPATDPPIADLIVAPQASALAPLENAVPMPTRVDIHPDFTDVNVPQADTARLITPHDLALALSTAQEAMGGDRIDVLDLVHCFAASIEELYEVGPYAEATVAAPNFTFFAPEMAGAALATIGDTEISDPETAVAGDIMSTYFDTIPSANHPHIMVAVDNDQLPAVKEAWDKVATGLMDNFATDAAGTAAALVQAYSDAADSGTVYDTTFCGQEPDFALTPPDALSDMANFASELRFQFAAIDPDLADDAKDARQAIEKAVTSSAQQNGEPWWDPNPDTWNFSGMFGIALFTPIEPMMVEETAYHTWQALWYTSAITIAQDVPVGGEVKDVFNPHPYAFVQPANGQATWADVLHRFWRVQQIDPRSDVPTALCLPEIQEEEAPDLTLALQGEQITVLAGSSLTYTAEVVNQTTLTMEGVVVTYTLPGEVTVTAVPGECQQSGRLVSCELGALAGHETRTLNLPGEVDPHADGVLEATIAVTADQVDVHPEDNTVTVSVVVEPLSFIYVPTIME